MVLLKLESFLVGFYSQAFSWRSVFLTVPLSVTRKKWNKIKNELATSHIEKEKKLLLENGIKYED